MRSASISSLHQRLVTWQGPSAAEHVYSGKRQSFAVHQVQANAPQHGFAKINARIVETLKFGL
jgi:hypothetical protein